MSFIDFVGAATLIALTLLVICWMWCKTIEYLWNHNSKR